MNSEKRFPSLSIAVLIFAYVLGGLVACAENKGSSPQPTWSSGQDAYISSTRATRLADEFAISCPAEGCSGQVGALFMATFSSSSTCTAFLAGEYEGKTAIITNKHCVDRVTNCVEEVAFRLPSTGERARCDRILSISRYGLDDENGRPATVPDYAVVLLDRKLSTSPLPLSQEGVAPLSPVRVVVMQPQGSRSMRMETRSCSTGTANVWTPGYSDSRQPNVTLFQCGVVSGNSGAPALDANGRVVAIVQIGTRAGASSDFGSSIDAREFQISSVGVATNLACVESSALGLRPMAACVVSSPTDSRETARARSIEGLQSELTNPTFLLPLVETTDRFIREDSGRLFGWTVRNDDAHRVPSPSGIRPMLSLELVPKCVLRAEDPDSQLRPRFLSEAGRAGQGRWATTGTQFSSLPGGIVTVMLDRYARFAFRMHVVSKLSTFEFNPRRVAELRNDETVEVRERIGSASVTHVLPLCPLGYHSKELRDNQELLAIMRTGNREAYREYMANQSAREREAGRTTPTPR